MRERAVITGNFYSPDYITVYLADKGLSVIRVAKNKVYRLSEELKQRRAFVYKCWLRGIK